MSHLQQNCLYQSVTCRNQCGKLVRHGGLNNHLSKNCPKRIVKCKYCAREGYWKDITDPVHIEECPEYPLKCSVEGHGLTLVHKEMALHKCPKK